MRLSTSVNLDTTAKQPIDVLVELFQQAGYVRTDDAQLTFTRGSIVGSFISFSPSSWKVRVVIDLAPLSETSTRATIRFSINTIGQIVTANEREYWRAELTQLAHALGSTDSSVQVPHDIAQRSLSENLQSVIGIFVLIFVGAGLAPHVSSDSDAAMYGGLLGLAVGIALTWKRLRFFS